MTVPKFTLSNGNTIPAIAYGSSDLPDAVDLLLKALKAGYRHIDTAEIYNSEEDVRKAIELSGLKREELYITTKVNRLIKDPVASLAKSLKRLGTDYVDQFLIHSPYAIERQGAVLEEVWKGLEQTYKEGKAKSIGVSNFRVQDLERLLAIAEIKPVANQIEYSPYLQNQNPGIVKYCQDHGILVTAYSPMHIFTAPDGPLTPLLKELAEKYNKTPGQIVFRWIYQRGVLSITTTVKPERNKEALESFGFVLDDKDVDRITSIGASFHLQRYPQGLKK